VQRLRTLQIKEVGLISENEIVLNVFSVCPIPNPVQRFHQHPKEMCGRLPLQLNLALSQSGA